MVNSKRHAASSSKRSSEPTAGDSNQTDANGDQPAKRSRVSRACDQCRASRERCDGAQPKCQTCTSQDRSCSYNEQPKKRGIQPNYIRTLELTLAWIFQTFPEAEARLTGGLPLSEDVVHRLIGGKDADATETLHTAWRDCLVNKQIEQMLSGTTIDHIGLSIHGNSNLSYSSPPLSAPSDGSGLRQNNFAVSEASRSGETRYQLPTDAWTLLEYYFAFTHAWLPMAEKSSILKTVYSYPAEGLPRDGVNAAEHAELWAIMALTSTQRRQEACSRDGIQWVRQLAESLLPTGNAPFELPHIRALIILAMVDMHDDHMLAAWLRIGGVVRILYLFKLLQSLGQTTRFCRHIHLVAFVIESTLALHLKTPGHLTSDYVASIGFVDEDGMEEWTPWQDPLNTSHYHGTKAPARSFSTLNELVRIYMRLVEQTSAQATNSESTNSVAFTLMKNAASNTGRVQPSDLVASWRTAIPAQFDVSSYAAANSSMDFPHVANPEPGPGIDLPIAHKDHPFMSIPNESNAYASPAIVQSSTFWNTDGSMNLTVQATSPEARFDGTSADIFEELANLERQDSSQHPQFMRNLGFAPDFDLAEFFGEDYQPSDPLLAYLQPSGYNVPQNSAETNA